MQRDQKNCAQKIISDDTSRYMVGGQRYDGPMRTAYRGRQRRRYRLMERGLVGTALGCMLGCLVAGGCGARSASVSPTTSLSPFITPAPSLGSTTVESNGPTTPPASGPTTSLPAGMTTIDVNRDSNGATITVGLHQSVVVTLDTTNWTFQPISDPSIMGQSAQVVTPGPIGCQALASCGSVSVRLAPHLPGRAVVRATREKCGELRRCAGSDALFSITLAVGQ